MFYFQLEWAFHLVRTHQNGYKIGIQTYIHIKYGLYMFIISTY